MGSGVRHRLIGHTDLGAAVAYRADGPVSAQTFLRDAAGLARALPTDKDVLNLCEDRYRFAVTFAAVALAGRTNLLPQNRTPRTLEQVVETHPNSFAIAEAPVPGCPVPVVLYETHHVAATHTPAVPAIAPERVVALVFTSGSTGVPKSNVKRWGMLTAGASAERAALDLPARFNILGTVPPQHMYGLESTVLLPLLAGGAFHVGRPLFPNDVADALAQMPSPRVLVTAPVHIRACLEADVRFPALDLIVSAAAPLSVALARDAERRYGATVREIYGFTEAGMVAVRRTIDDGPWQTMPDIQLVQTEGEWSFAGGHVDSAKVPTDTIDVLGATTFNLAGRRDDIVNVAGKRASLADLSHKLAEIHGVIDGIFHVPDAVDGAVQRLMAFVVAPALTATALRRALRTRIDPAFLPRPLVLVDQLPRAASGKLSLDALRALEREYACKAAQRKRPSD
ncbi:MAG: AMP-binding protein [Burkholderiales bacterium]